MSLIGDTAQVSGALFAAVAAGASWATVAQVRKQRHEETLPNLQIVLDSHDSLDFRVYNAGSGAARAVAYVFAADRMYESEEVGDGYLAPGGWCAVHTDLPVPEERMVTGLVCCRDVHGVLWARPGHGAQIKLEPKDGDGLYYSPREVWARVFGSDDLGDMSETAKSVNKLLL